MPEPTVTIDLPEFDEIRDRADKYKAVNQGLEGLLNFLKDKEEAEDPGDKKTKRPFSTYKEQIKEYNSTKPEHPFTL